MQPIDSEYSWTEKIEPISDRILAAKSTLLKIGPADDLQWMALSSVLYYSSQLHVPLINTLSILDKALYGTYIGFVKNGVLPFGSADNKMTSKSKPTPDILDFFDGRNAVFLEKVTACLEDASLDIDITLALLEICRLQSQAITWARERGDFNRFACYVFDSKLRLTLMQNYMAKACEQFVLKSNYSVGVVTRYKIFPESKNPKEAIKSGLFKDSHPDIHLALMFQCRSALKTVVGANEQEYSLFGAEAILQTFPFAFQPPEGVYFNQKAFIFLTQTIGEAFQNMELVPSMARSETLYLLASMSFVLEQLLNVPPDQKLGAMLLSLVEALVETVVLVLPPNTVPKFIPVFQRQLTSKDIQGHKAILLAAEKYNLKAEIQTEKLSAIIEVLAIAMGSLEMALPKGFIILPSSPVVPFKVYLAAAKVIAINRKIPFHDLANRFKAIQIKFLELGAEGLRNPNHPKSLEFKKKYKDVYDAIFKAMPSLPVQISPKKRETAVKELVQQEDNKVAEARNKNQRRRNRIKARKVAKQTEEPRIVEVDFDTEEEIKPVILQGSCTSLAIFYADEDSEDESVDNQESSGSIGNAIISLDPVRVQTFKPERVEILLDDTDWELLQDWDARDIAYSYLIIGNYIYSKFLTPLLTSLNRNYNNMRELFNTSIDAFKAELLHLKVDNPGLFEQILFQARITDAGMLCKCLTWYSKRLTITHQHKAIYGVSRQSTALDFVSMLYQTELGFELSERIAEAFDFDNETDLRFFEIPLERPGAFPFFDSVNFELSVLALYNLMARTDEGTKYGEHEMLALRDLRNRIAHCHPNLAQVRHYIRHIYATHRDSKFLCSILTSDLSITY